MSQSILCNYFKVCTKRFTLGRAERLTRYDCGKLFHRQAPEKDILVLNMSILSPHPFPAYLYTPFPPFPVPNKPYGWLWTLSTMFTYLLLSLARHWDRQTDRDTGRGWQRQTERETVDRERSVRAGVPCVRAPCVCVCVRVCVCVCVHVCVSVYKMKWAYSYVFCKRSGLLRGAGTTKNHPRPD